VIIRWLKENWGVALVLTTSLLISTLVLVCLQPREPDLPTYDYSEARTAYYQPGGRSCEPIVLATITDRAKALAERNRCTDAAEEYRLKSNDLVQQARTADAAAAETALTHYLARLGLWGAVGGFLTLIAASLAAYFARNAAYAARDSYNAFIAVEDAYLIVEFPSISVVEETDVKGVKNVRYSATATITNIGRTAAYLRFWKIGDRMKRLDATLDKGGKPLQIRKISIPTADFDLIVEYSSTIRPLAVLATSARVRLGKVDYVRVLERRLDFPDDKRKRGK
jgi:hypothetical protein